MADPDDVTLGDEPDEDDGTVWIGQWHVDVGSAAYKELTNRGLKPGPAPTGAA